VWVGAGTVLMLALPFFIWQAAHGWPMRDLIAVTASGGKPRRALLSDASGRFYGFVSSDVGERLALGPSRVTFRTVDCNFAPDDDAQFVGIEYSNSVSELFVDWVQISPYAPRAPLAAGGGGTGPGECWLLGRQGRVLRRQTGGGGLLRQLAAARADRWEDALVATFSVERLGPVGVHRVGVALGPRGNARHLLREPAR
jgi:hypothetical protein